MLDSTPSIAVKIPINAVMPKVIIPEVIQDLKEFFLKDWVDSLNISETLDKTSQM